jgi:L-ascorbate metabolism protein UlaG (beta-lactamase superfamily)
MLFATLTISLALTGATLPQQSGETPQGDPTRRMVGGSGIVASENQVQVMYLANEGFLLRSGNFSILIDAFIKEAHDGHEALPKKSLRQLQSGKKPFNGFIFALVSHAHPDHFDPRVMARFLGANKKAALMTSPDVATRVAEVAQDISLIEQQVKYIRCVPGVPKSLDRGPMNMGVEFMLLPHAGDESGEVVNYGHLVNVGGFKLLHMGDAAPSKAAFAPFDLGSKEIDIAFVPYWFFMSEEGIDIIDSVIKPRYTVVCHVPSAEKELFGERMALENPHVIYFNEALESKIFDKNDKSEVDPGAADSNE